MQGHRLIVDLGGTNARFARCDARGVGPVTRLALADHADFAGALDAALTAARELAGPERVAIAAAGPVDGDRVRLTNAPWTVEADDVAARLGAPVRLLNDLEAVALALPALAEADVETVRAGPPHPGPRLALNLGTGFGAAVAVPGPHGWQALATEAGHMRFAAVTEAERALSEMVETYEDVCSGRGIAGLHARLSGRPGATDGPRASEIMAARDPIATAVREVVLSVFGRIAGDLVLATGAWGGLWLCGGVITGWEAAWRAPFLEHFSYKGPMTERMRALPVHRITHPDPVLLGLSRV